MARGERRGNREAKKPKQPKAKEVAPVSPFTSLEIPSQGEKLRLRTLVRRALRRAPSPSPWDSHEPIREELFGPERLEEHARSLALAQKVTAKLARGHPLASRLANNAAVLLHAYRSIGRTIEDGHAITPA